MVYGLIPRLGILSLSKFASMTGKGSPLKFFYAVGVGRKRGVYETWPECKAQVENIYNAKFRKFPTREEAQEFVDKHASPASSPEKAYQSPQKQYSMSQPVNLQKRFAHTEASTQENPQDAKRLKCQSQPLSDTERSQPQPSTSRSDDNSVAGPSGNNKDSPPGALEELRVQLEQLRQKHDSLADQLNRIVDEKREELNRLNAEIKKMEETIRDQNGRLDSLQQTVDKVKKKSKVDRTAKEIEPQPSTSSLVAQPSTSRVKSEPSVCQSVKTEPSNQPQDHIDLHFDDDDHCIIYTDGCCLSNGQSGARAGIGVWFGENNKLNTSAPFRGNCRPTNNNAEIQAATLAINVAKFTGITKVHIHTDSMFTIKCVNEWLPKWKSNGWKTAAGKPVANKEELELLIQAQESVQVKWKYVQGHANITGNEGADRLAKLGALEYMPPMSFNS